VSTPSERIAVIGAGVSALIVDLVGRGYRSIEAVDISATALGRLRTRLGEHADAVRFVHGDVCNFVVDEPIDVWHDRATFHFLTEPEEQAAYGRRASAALRTGGQLIVAVFAANGPEQCSGLPVACHDVASLESCFETGFRLIESFQYDHCTPWGVTQPFTYALFRRH
jgi:SAM-dependent methyltransferase